MKITGDGGNSSITMLGVATNPVTAREEIVYLYTIYAERKDLENFDHRFNYYRFDGGWLEGIEGGRYSITEDEFYAIRVGLGDIIISWRDLSDSTEQILTMVARLPNW